MKTAQEVRANATRYKSDISLKDGFELWGTATGLIPYHRQWWILKDDEIVGYLDQGCYENAGQAAAERHQWAMSLGCRGLICKRNPQTKEYEFVDPYAA